MISSFKNWAANEDVSRIASLLILAVLIKSVLIANVEVINPDGVRYINSAHELMQGNLHQAFVHEKMLFFSFTLGLFHFLIGDWFLAGQVVSAFFLTITLIPLYFLTKDLFGSKAAWWGCLAFIVLPSVNGMSAEVIKGGPFLFFMACALFFGNRAITGDAWPFFPLTFICGSLASLYRFEGIVFILGYFLFLTCLLLGKEKRSQYLKGLGGYVILPLLAAAVFGGLFLTGAFGAVEMRAIWTRFADHYFKFDLLKNYYVVYDFLKVAEEQLPNGLWGQDFCEIARHNLVWIYFFGILGQFVEALWAVFLIPFIWGIVASDRRDSGFLLLIWIAFLFFFMNYLVLIRHNFHSLRYLMVVVLLVMPLVGLGMEKLVLWLKRKKRANLFLLAMIIVIFLSPAADSFENSFEDEKEIRQAGEWLKSNLAAERLKMATNEERVFLHAGLLRKRYELLEGQGDNVTSATLAEKGFDVFVLYGPWRGTAKVPEFENYSRIQHFAGAKKMVVVFQKNDAARPD
jgi:hypothetical protein